MTIELTKGEMNAIAVDLNMPNILSHFPEVLVRLAHLHDVRAIVEYKRGDAQASTYHTLRASLLYRESRKLETQRDATEKFCGRCGGKGHHAHECKWHALACRRDGHQPPEVRDSWFQDDVDTVAGFPELGEDA